MEDFDGIKKQQSISQTFSITGQGLHQGRPCRVTCIPAPENHGIVFRKGKEIIELRTATLDSKPGYSQITNGRITIKTIEHILAAFHALGVDNAVVDITDLEIPILDGSSQQWVEYILKAGLITQDEPRIYLRINNTKSFILPNGVEVKISPARTLTISVEITNNAFAGSKTGCWVITPQIFIQEIAPARTFCFLQDVAQMRSLGLIVGGSLDCAVVFDENYLPVNTEGVRYRDEPIRHKILDLVGDMYLLGYPVVGYIKITNPTHISNMQLASILPLISEYAHLPE